VSLSKYEDYHDAFQHEAYMHKCIHSSLGYLTLVEFESQWLVQQAAVQVM